MGLTLFTLGSAQSLFRSWQPLNVLYRFLPLLQNHKNGREPSHWSLTRQVEWCGFHGSRNQRI